jgi:hypothetical protein
MTVDRLVNTIWVADSLSGAQQATGGILSVPVDEKGSCAGYKWRYGCVAWASHPP